MGKGTGAEGLCEVVWTETSLGPGVGDLENGDKGTREEPVAARAPGGRSLANPRMDWQACVAGASPEMGRVGHGPGLLGP